MNLDKSDKIYVAGHRGLVGSAICRQLSKQKFTNVIFKTHDELDLENKEDVEEFFFTEKPKIVFLAAAKVGGIIANNNFPVDFLMTNLSIQSNVINACYKTNVERLIFLGSSCIYPKICPQPIKEDYLLTSQLEPTNRPYALAKIAGIEMCWAYNRQYRTKYLSVMPSNLYGLNDNYDLDNSHLIPALIRKIHEASTKNLKNVFIWGTGSPRREFLFSDDLAIALINLMQLDERKFSELTNISRCPLINVGYGHDHTIYDIAKLISSIVGYSGSFDFDKTKPDGTFEKLLDSSLISSYGWTPKTDIKEGIRIVYNDYKENYLNSY